MSFRGRRRQLALVWVCVVVAVRAVVAGSIAIGHHSSNGSTDSAPPIASPASSPAPSPAMVTPASSEPTRPTASASTPPRPPDDQPGPVILVPGYGGNESMLDHLASLLRNEGRTTTTLALPDGATGDLRGQEQVLAAAVSKALASGAPSVDLVGYSAGGIVVGLFVAAQPSQVRRVVTIGAPLHGTRLAGLAAGLLPSACPAACEQMVPGSSLLALLDAASPTLTGVPWLSTWTSIDQVVTPPDSARFAGATNIELQSVCADDRATHVTLPEDALVAGLTVRALGTSPLPLASASASDCSALRALGSDAHG